MIPNVVDVVAMRREARLTRANYSGEPRLHIMKSATCHKSSLVWSLVLVGQEACYGERTVTKIPA